MQTQIIIGLAIAIVAAIVGYYVLRYLKGTLKLQINRDTASSGELLSGTVMLEVKKSTTGLLKVSLVGHERRRTQSSSNSGSSTKMVEVYRDDLVLEESREFASGFSKTYPFELTAPSSSAARSGAAILNELAGNTGSDVMDNVLKVAAGFAKQTASRIYWRVEASLDAEGVDLYTKEKVQVNLRD
jgi:hypothetical protein